jgi:Novel STAND NTPase 1
VRRRSSAPTSGHAGGRRSPYQGLVPYTEDDAEWFFGRAEWRDVLADNLRAYRITVLYGASGVGKSSLLRAGLVRGLREEARESLGASGAPRLLPVAFSAWSLDDPLAALRQVVHRAGAELVSDASGPPPEGALGDVLEAWAGRAGGPVLLVLDQLEELFVYHGRPDATLDELADALRRRDPAVHYLLSIREEALARLDGLEGPVAGLGDHLLRLEALDRDAAREAIVEPVERWNATAAAPEAQVEIEPALVVALLDQVATGEV